MSLSPPWAPPPTHLERPTIVPPLIPLWYPALHHETPHNPIYVRGMGIWVIHPHITHQLPLYPPPRAISTDPPYLLPLPVWEVGNHPHSFPPHKSPFKIHPIFPPHFPPRNLPLFHTPISIPKIPQLRGGGGQLS